MNQNQIQGFVTGQGSVFDTRNLKTTVQVLSSEGAATSGTQQMMIPTQKHRHTLGAPMPTKGLAQGNSLVQHQVILERPNDYTSSQGNHLSKEGALTHEIVTEGHMKINLGEYSEGGERIETVSKSNTATANTKLPLKEMMHPNAKKHSEDYTAKAGNGMVFYNDHTPSPAPEDCSSSSNHHANLKNPNYSNSQISQNQEDLLGSGTSVPKSGDQGHFQSIHNRTLLYMNEIADRSRRNNIRGYNRSHQAHTYKLDHAAFNTIEPKALRTTLLSPEARHPAQRQGNFILEARGLTALTKQQQNDFERYKALLSKQLESQKIVNRQKLNQWKITVNQPTTGEPSDSRPTGAKQSLQSSANKLPQGDPMNVNMFNDRENREAFQTFERKMIDLLPKSRATTNQYQTFNSLSSVSQTNVLRGATFQKEGSTQPTPDIFTETPASHVILGPSRTLGGQLAVPHTKAGSSKNQKIPTDASPSFKGRHSINDSPSKHSKHSKQPSLQTINSQARHSTAVQQINHHLVQQRTSPISFQKRTLRSKEHLTMGINEDPSALYTLEKTESAPRNEERIDGFHTSYGTNSEALGINLNISNVMQAPHVGGNTFSKTYLKTFNEFKQWERDHFGNKPGHAKTSGSARYHNRYFLTSITSAQRDFHENLKYNQEHDYENSVIKQNYNTKNGILFQQNQMERMFPTNLLNDPAASTKESKDSSSVRSSQQRKPGQKNGSPPVKLKGTGVSGKKYRTKSVGNSIRQKGSIFDQRDASTIRVSQEEIDELDKKRQNLRTQDNTVATLARGETAGIASAINSRIQKPLTRQIQTRQKSHLLIKDHYQNQQPQQQEHASGGTFQKGSEVASRQDPNFSSFMKIKPKVKEEAPTSIASLQTKDPAKTGAGSRQQNFRTIKTAESIRAKSQINQKQIYNKVMLSVLNNFKSKFLKQLKESEQGASQPKVQKDNMSSTLTSSHLPSRGKQPAVQSYPLGRREDLEL